MFHHLLRTFTVLGLLFCTLFTAAQPQTAHAQSENSNISTVALDFVPHQEDTTQTASFPFFDDFETDTLGSDWLIYTSDAGLVELSTDNPHSGTSHIFLGQKQYNNAYAYLSLLVDLANQKDVFLDFWWRATGNVSSDGNASAGVYISDDDGTSWKKILDLSSNTQFYNHEFINLKDAASAQGLTLNSHFRIYFYYRRTNTSQHIGGLRLDEVRLTTRAQEVMTFPMEDGFESESFAQGFYPASGGNGVTEISSDGPHSGAFHIFLGQKQYGNTSASLKLFVDLSNQEDVFLDFWWRAVGSASPDSNASGGVFISGDNGVNWKRIIDLSSNTQSYNHEFANLFKAAKDNGLDLNDHFMILFLFQRSNNGISLGGLRLDDIRLTTYSKIIAPFPIQEGFEQNRFVQGLYPRSGWQGIVEINSENSYNGNYHVFIGQKQVDDAYALVDLFTDLSAQTNVFLDFWWRTTGDVSSNGNAGSSGVYISDDNGVNWTKVMHLTSSPQPYQHAIIDVAKAARDSGKVLNNHFLIRFFFRRSNNSLVIGSIRLDEIRLSNQDPISRIYLPVISR